MFADVDYSPYSCNTDCTKYDAAYVEELALNACNTCVSDASSPMSEVLKF